MKNVLIGLILVLIYASTYAGDEICVDGIAGIYSVKTPDYSAIINHRASSRQVVHVRFNDNRNYNYAMFFDNGSGDIKILRGNLARNSCDQGNVYINGMTEEYEYEITKRCPPRERRSGFNVRNLPLNMVTNQNEAAHLLRLHRQINLNMSNYLAAEIQKQSLSQYNIKRLK